MKSRTRPIWRLQNCLWAALVGLSLALAACEPIAPTLQPDPSLTSAGAYPPPSRAPQEPAAYPPPSEASGTLLAFDRPIEASDIEVSGVGPPGLIVYVVNSTFMGEELGSGVVGDDGTFSIQVAPLPAGIRIGLSADLEASGIDESEVRPGEGAIQVPQVGNFFDSVVLPQE
ncbi:MAG: hypothetical protein ACRDHL_08575 [Candidatus Promineifilaceae bacterium]